MDLLGVVAIVALAIWAWFLFLKPLSGKRLSGELPPGPYPFPVIGNILQLGQLPHRSLSKLSQTYGPLMSLHLGTLYTVVVSSADVAKQLFTKHDQLISSRTITTAMRAHDHHKFPFAFLPVGTEWRRYRKLSKEHLFSIARLDASEELRQEKVEKLRDYVQKCCDAGRVVNVAQASYITTLNLMSATLFSAELADFDSDSGQDFKSVTEGIISVLGDPNVTDFFPVLQWIDPQGVKKRSEFYFGKLLAFMEDTIKQRVELRASPDFPKKTDFLEILLDLEQGSEFNYTRKEIAHLLFEFILGGSDTTSTAVEWAMTELLLNPEKLSKAKQELRTVVGKDKQVQESDVARLPYLQAVIKEAYRYHPPSPLLVPRKSDDDIEINGYTIPKGTQVMINAWAIGRDPNRWSNPDTFEPERFLYSKIDFKGQDFDLLPFGTGRRICPGMPLVNRILPLMLAALIHHFDWKLESKLKPGEMEVAEKFGISVRKAVPLTATPIKMG